MRRLEFILSKRFQCTKTGFQRCAMQITIAIKGALSSVRAHFDKIFDLTFNILIDMNNEEKKKRKHGRLVEQIADDMKRIADGTKQNKKRQKVYAVPRGSQFCKSGLGILRKVKDKPTWLSFELMQYLVFHAAKFTAIEILTEDEFLPSLSII
ncbi:hypothetical protein T06_12637 [Trichinella sp. T6]|nr:hypothetical protein T06_12637 [Trichinella sp. T6]